MMNPPLPWNPTMALCLRTHGDPMGVGVSDERGTRVPTLRSQPYRGGGVTALQRGGAQHYRGGGGG